MKKGKLLTKILQKNKDFQLYCPVCGQKILKDDCKKWVVTGAEVGNGQSFDGAYTTGGRAAFFTTETARIVKKYKCRACGYTHID